MSPAACGAVQLVGSCERSTGPEAGRRGEGEEEEEDEDTP